AIMVGSETVRLDDPYLTVRDAPGDDPLRVVPASLGELPLTSHLLSDGGRTLVAVSEAAPEARVSALRGRGVDIVTCGTRRVDLEALLEHLGSIGIGTVVVEGGATLLSSLFRGGLVDRLVVQHLPVVFGGDDT